MLINYWNQGYKKRHIPVIRNEKLMRIIYKNRFFFLDKFIINFFGFWVLRETKCMIVKFYIFIL